jgi:hypothetical protein
VEVLNCRTPSNLPPITLYFESSSNRIYTLQCREGLTEGAWSNVTGRTRVRGTGGPHPLSDPTANDSRNYRLNVTLP